MGDQECWDNKTTKHVLVRRAGTLNQPAHWPRALPHKQGRLMHKAAARHGDTTTTRGVVLAFSFRTYGSKWSAIAYKHR